MISFKNTICSFNYVIFILTCRSTIHDLNFCDDYYFPKGDKNAKITKMRISWKYPIVWYSQICITNEF